MVGADRDALDDDDDARALDGAECFRSRESELELELAAGGGGGGQKGVRLYGGGLPVAEYALCRGCCCWL